MGITPGRGTNKEDHMNYLRDLFHDLRVAWDEFRYIRRHLRNGGNPDERAF